MLRGVWNAGEGRDWSGLLIVAGWTVLEAGDCLLEDPPMLKKLADKEDSYD